MTFENMKPISGGISGNSKHLNWVPGSGQSLYLKDWIVLPGIWINNTLVGTTENMLIDHRFDVTDLLNPAGENTIYVRIDPAVIPEPEIHHPGSRYEVGYLGGAIACSKSPAYVWMGYYAPVSKRRSLARGPPEY